MSKAIKIAVSSCLAGLNLRYDGGNKYNTIIRDLCENFECVYICPESAIGLGTPRPPLKLFRIDETIKARGRTNPNFDVTDALTEYANTIASQHDDICGYIFKARSPSCGVKSTPWFGESNDTHGFTSGIYSNQLINQLAELPVIEETQLTDESDRQQFVKNVNRYARKRGNVIKEDPK